MQTTVRTTIRIRKDLIDQSRLIAVKNGSSLQDVINNTLAKGFSHISDLETRKNAMKGIDRFRKSLTGKKINVARLVEGNKRELDARTSRLLRHTSGE